MQQAIVIGSGFGGLATAIRLQAAGFQVTLLEKNAQTGGHASVLKKEGYTFDMGPSIITAPDIIESVFAVAGRRMADYLDLVYLDPFYRVYFADGSVMDYTADAERMKKEIAKFDKDDAANYDRFVEYIRELYQIVIEDGLGAKPFDLRRMIKFSPQAMKLSALRPAHTVVAKFFKHPNIRFLFSFHSLFIGGNPFRAPSVYLMIPYLEKKGGVWFSKGGMYSLVEAFERIFRELGGTVLTNHEVSQIIVENGRAVGVVANDIKLDADLVVTNAHFAHTQLDLIPGEHRRKWTDRRVKKLEYSMSCFLLYIGSRKQYPQLCHHTLILSERYKDLVTDIFDRKILADDFSMYLHVPSRTDPSMAPEGCESMYVLVPVPNLAAEIDWSSMASIYAERILAFLENDFGMTDLRSSIDVLEIFTPDDFQSQRNNYLGSAWGVEPRLTQTASFRPGNRSEDIKGLYVVGASTHPGAGVPGVLLGAEATVSAVLDDFPAARHRSQTTVEGVIS